MQLARMWCFLGTVLLPFLASADALDQWPTRTPPVPVILQDVIYARGLFVAIGRDTGSSIARLIVSSNGTDWVRFASQSRVSLRSLAYGTNGLFVGVGATGFGDGEDTPGVIVSTNGTNWSFFQTFGSQFGAKTNFFGVTYGNGLFVAVGQNGAAVTSHDGSNWVSQGLPTQDTLHTVAYGNGLWVASGVREPDGGPTFPDLGPLLVSTNGTNWALITNAFNAVRILYAHGRFTALAGDNFTTNPSPMRYSFDGTNWTDIIEPSTNLLRNITYGGGLFTAVGTGIIKISFDGTNWVQRFPNPAVTNSLRAVAYGTNTFVAVGDVIVQSGDIRPRLRVEVVPDPFGSPYPDHRLYLRGLSNASYAIEVSQNLTNWQQRVSPQTATGGDDLFYIYGGSVGNGFRRARQVP
jgi:hypothetical protein